MDQSENSYKIITFKWQYANSLSKDDNCTSLLDVLGSDAMGDVISSITTVKVTNLALGSHKKQKFNQCMTTNIAIIT